MIIQSRRVWVLNDWLQAQIAVEGQKIAGIYPWGTFAPDADYGNLRLVPGFIDVHTHGAYGFDTNDADPAGLRKWARKLVEEGVTGFLPTTITQSEEVLTRALRNVARVVREGYRPCPQAGGPGIPPAPGQTAPQTGEGTAEREGYTGAQILGIHFEGPYLDPAHKGAQPERFCVPPDLDQFRRYLAASDGLIRIVTLACELDRDWALTKFLHERGIVPSLGHSGASFGQAALAFANGAGSITHTYNGMAPFHHRDNGIVGAAFRFRDVFSEVICDGRHSTPAALYAFFACKGPDYGVMVTDSLRVKGLPAGTRTQFGGNLIELYEDGSAHLVGPGNLAGSTLRMHEGLRILVEEAGVPWQAAINACTRNPARLIGMGGTKGSIQAGKDADLVVLGDDYSVQAAYVLGSLAYGAKSYLHGRAWPQA